MSLVEVSLTLPAPPERVWAVVMDPHHLASWVTIQRELLSADAGPPREGFRMSQRLHLRGMNVDIDWVLVQCSEAELAVWQGRGPAHSRAHTEYRLAADGDETRFDYHTDFKAPFGPLGAAVSRALVGATPEREARNSLTRLRDLLKD